MCAFFRIAGCILLCATALASFPGSGAAQSATNVCLKSGITIRASRIETREGKYLFYPQGASTPVEEDPVNVRCIGCDECAGTPPPPPPPPPVNVKFGIAGSNTIGEALMPAIISAYGKKTYGTTPVSVPVPGQQDEQTIKLGNPDAPAAIIDFKAHGSGTAPKPLKERSIQIGMMSRRMKPEEVTDIQSALHIDPTEHVLALDGVAVILYPDNPIKKLSLDQIAAIFAGEITDWSKVHGKNDRNEDVTGPSLPIKVHARDNRSGTFDTFKALVLEPFHKTISPQAARYESSDELSAAVSNPKETGGIGFIGFAYINKSKPVNILSQCGLNSQPEPYLVKLEAYPLARRLYLYTVGEPSEPVARGILQFALSDEAQSIVVDNGFIDKSVGYQEDDKQSHWLSTLVSRPDFGLPGDKQVPDSATRDLARRTQGYRRSSVVFRFETGRADLDLLASEQVGRLARYLQQQNGARKRVLLIGFADSVGEWYTNQTLAHARAQTIASKLQDHGIRIGDDQLISMSYAAPFACNDEEKNGRQLNRRVEVWIAE